MALHLLVLGILALPGLDTLTPRISFLAGSAGRWRSHLDMAGVRNTTMLLLSSDETTLYVGARDTVFSLNVSQPGVMQLSRKLDWSPSAKDLGECAMKGKEQSDCPNFIRVLQLLNQSVLYACGTHAFSPRCTYIDTESLTQVSGSKWRAHEGRGRCPYDPYQRNTAIVVDGELYTGTVADYMGNRPVISRHLSHGSHIDLKLDDTLGWLDDPTFVSSASITGEEKVYFFFTEVGKEYDFMEKLLVSRVAQVCTDDVGGQRTLQRRWTTFAKAQLLCQADSELPYGVLQDVTTMSPPQGSSADQTLFYGIFTSQWPANSAQSAVCAFRLADVKGTFAGNYKVLNRDTLRWNSRVQEKTASPGECGLHSAPDQTLRFVKDNFLTEQSVRPVGGGITLLSADQRYSKITAQRTQAANGRSYTILYLLAESGFLHKVVLLDSGPHIIEEVQVFEGLQPVTSLILSHTQSVLYVGWADGVAQLPVSNCSFYPNCGECVLARDPFCGWNPVSQACVSVTHPSSTIKQDLEDGKVNHVCHIGPKPRSGLQKPSSEKLLQVCVSELVQLECPQTSRLARISWERANGSLSPELYLQDSEGRLRFLQTPSSLGRYYCYSEENSYRQLLATFLLQPCSDISTTTISTTTTPTPKHKPTHQMPTTGWRSSGRLVPDVGVEPASGVLDLLPQATSRTYYRELVAVSVLLCVSLCALVCAVLYGARQRWHSRTAPHTGPEQDPLQAGSPTVSNAKQALRNGTPYGSNGYLPNTPT